MPNDAFRWKQEPWGRALECVPLAAVARHLFSTRDLDSASREHPAPVRWDALAASLGVTADRVVRVRQVHGRTVFRADPAADRRTNGLRQGYGQSAEASAKAEVLRHEEVRHDAARHEDGQSEPPAADAIVGTDPTSAFAVRVADCVPVLIADRRTGAAAAVHAGWRGTAASLCTAVVEELTAAGSAPGDLIAAVGPSIGPCCYVVGRDLPGVFLQGGHARDDINRWFRATEGSNLILDLWRANADMLEAAGIASDSLHISGLCTACHPELFHSYRRDGAGAGRLVALIRPGATI